MLAKDKILKETSPLSIFFVKSGSGGNRLLFRYPYDETFQYEQELELYNDLPLVALEQDRLQFQSVINENEAALCNLFSVHPNLCGQKFEIKINSVRHVGHPMSLLPTSTPTATLIAKQSNDNPIQTSRHHARINLDLDTYDCLTAPNRTHQNRYNRGDITSFNIVCALRSSASYDIVDCYHDLSKRLAIALSFEERRCSYLSKEIKIILATLEENDMAKLTDRDRREQSSSKVNSLLESEAAQVGSSSRLDSHGFGYDGDPNEGSVFSLILKRSNLARDLKRVFVNLSTTGIVDLKINNWVSVSFCLPQRVHRLKLLTHKSMPAIGTKDINRCLTYLRPYHGLLLLQESQELLDSLPIDASPAFIQLTRVIKPDKNFMELSVDANLTLMQIFNIASQLIYWAKATVIYPICDSNIYAIHPLASTGLNSKLANSFKTRFPASKSLHHYLAEFSEGISLSQLNGPLLSVEEKSILLSIVTWLLQRRILTQIHKYIFLVIDRERSIHSNDNSSFRDQVEVSSNTIDLTNSSPRAIDINVPNLSYGSHRTNLTASSAQLNTLNSPYRNNDSLTRGPSSVSTSTNNNNGNHSSPHLLINKDSLQSEVSLDNSLIRRYRTDSLTDSQSDRNNYGASSPLSSTPNSNMEYPSPGNNDTHIIRGSSLSSSCPLDNPLNGMRGDPVSTAFQRAGISQKGIKTILGLPSGKNLDDLKLLMRLMPYFDGRHHVEDIMFFENLERSQILILCDKFREILYTCHYEDVAVSQLCPFSS